MVRIQHKRDDCIGCFACVDVAPNYWSVAADGLASLMGCAEMAGPFQIGVGLEEDLADLKEAARSCPIKAITIEEVD